MNEVYLRKAVHSDMDLIYQWANDLTVRKNSFSSEQIPYHKHVDWFSQMLNNKAVLQYIMMDGDLPVGQIRLNIDNESAEIGYSIASEYRGQGYGHKILQLIAEETRKNHPEIRKLIAKVKPENSSSNRLFTSEGYTLDYTNDTFYHYSLVL